jgi:DNA-binding response OmpR family regulator
MGIKLILADESITIRKVVQIMYRNSDVQLSLADSYSELLLSAKQFSPDVILLSPSFPGVQLNRDIALLQASRDKNPIPVVIIADRGEGIDAEICRSMSAAGFLYKPLDNRELRQLVARLASGESSQPEAMQAIPPLQIENAERPQPSEAPAPTAVESAAPVAKAAILQTPEQRVKIMMELFESFLSENAVLLTDALAKNLAPKLAPEIAGKIIESIDFSDLPFRIATIVEGIIQDLVPQLAEELITHEIDRIKEEASKLVLQEDQDQPG